MTYILGPNGTGKTAVLQALTRLFGTNHAQRRIRSTDFHVTLAEMSNPSLDNRSLWIEAVFEFPELKDAEGNYATIPVNFAHMRLKSADAVPEIRIRLDAQIDAEGEIEEKLYYVLEMDDNDEPTKCATVHKDQRNSIQVHYLPARRDPSDHITYAANSMLGRLLRSANWKVERDVISALTEQIGTALAGNASIKEIDADLANHWTQLHRGSYYNKPSISFRQNEIDSLLRYLTVGFTPGPDQTTVDFSRLSDGQKSLLYISLVLSIQHIGRKVLAQEITAFDVDILRPAVFTMVAVEEPENSLSPHYLGRVLSSLKSFSGHHDAQAIVATHSPSLLRRVAPENIRYLRMNAKRQTTVSRILMPKSTDDGYKFVREAVQAFPELYFARLVILGEGDSEEIVLPRLLQALGMADDETSISIVPLGGRHVNHFWRLLNGLGIPQVTLLDLDLGRNQGGWGRLKYAVHQRLAFPTPNSKLEPGHEAAFPKWDAEKKLRDGDDGRNWLDFLETEDVFFSSPLDLDLSMMQSFPEAYEAMGEALKVPAEKSIAAVLGEKHGDSSQYTADELTNFDAYHRRFKLGSKPAAHLEALARLDNAALKSGMPAELNRMLVRVATKLAELPE